MNTTFKMQVFEELIILSALWNFENLVDSLRCNALLAYVNYSRHSSPSSLKFLLFLKTKNPNAIENCENMVFWKVIKGFDIKKFLLCCFQIWVSKNTIILTMKKNSMLLALEHLNVLPSKTKNSKSCLFQYWVSFESLLQQKHHCWEWVDNTKIYCGQ